MVDATAFVDYILAHPDDDAPKLVYADWLEEHGDVRAERMRTWLHLQTILKAAWLRAKDQALTNVVIPRKQGPCARLAAVLNARLTEKAWPVPWVAVDGLDTRFTGAQAGDAIVGLLVRVEMAALGFPIDVTPWVDLVELLWGPDWFFDFEALSQRIPNDRYATWSAIKFARSAIWSGRSATKSARYAGGSAFYHVLWALSSGDENARREAAVSASRSAQSAAWLLYSFNWEPLNRLYPKPARAATAKT